METSKKHVQKRKDCFVNLSILQKVTREVFSDVRCVLLKNNNNNNNSKTKTNKKKQETKS